METLSPIQIAQAIGAPTASLLGTQRWTSPLHPNLDADELHYANGGGCVPFRITDRQAGTVISKIPAENAPGDVDGVYVTMTTACQTKAAAEAAIFAAIPDMDPSASVVRGLTVGGKEQIADIVGGNLRNFRDPPGQIAFSTNGGGRLHANIAALSNTHKNAVKAALAALPITIDGNGS